MKPEDQGALGDLVTARARINEGLNFVGDALRKLNSSTADDFLEIERLRRERNAFHESLDWILHIELETPAETIAAMRDKARDSLERPR